VLRREIIDEQRLSALRLRRVPLPASVVDVEPWEWHEGAWTRLFTVMEWQVGHLNVSVGGEQDESGAVAYWLYVSGDEDLSATSNRLELVHALADAGRLLDSLRRRVSPGSEN
jgi:hypothetical protein